MRVLIIGGLSDDKFLSKANPIVNNEKISRVYVFRAFGNVYEKNKKVLTAPFLINYSYSKGFKRIVFDIWSNIYFLTLLLRSEIDVVVGIYLYPYGLYASMLSRLARKPFILVLPGSDLQILIRSKKFLKFFKSANYWSVRGTSSKNSLVKMGLEESRIFVHHNVFDINKYSGDTIVPKIYDFIFVGYLRVFKRLDRLIQIIYELKKRHPSITCAIVGDGPELINIEELIDTLNLTDNVVLHSFTNDVSKYLKLSKIFLLTSDSEGLPMAIIEALSCGLPVISSNINDIPDLIQHGVNGFLVDPSDIQGFIKACDFLLGNEALCSEMGKNARLDIELKFKTNFSEDAQKDRWFKYLNSSIN